MIDRKKLLPASVVCFCLFLAGVVLLFYGCAYRNLPGGKTAPATAFEQVLAWNTAIAQANDGFADNVIQLQRSGFLTIDQAKSILLKQAAIALADQQITQQISAAATCATGQAGPNATPSSLDSYGTACAQVSSSALKAELAAMTAAIADLNNGMLLGVKDAGKREALNGVLVTIGELVGNIAALLTRQGVTP